MNDGPRSILAQGMGVMCRTTGSSKVYHRVFRFSLPILFHPNAPDSLSEDGTMNPLVADVPSGLSLIPAHE
jgi:hypothetical protein